MPRAPGPLSDAPWRYKDVAVSNTTLSLQLEDEAATKRLGEALGAFLLAAASGLFIYLSGDLGAGKTTLVRALLESLGISGPIKSPTFTLMEPYVAHLPQASGINQNVSLYCYHFDFYRFTDPREWLEAGFREHFDDHALCLVEWPEKAAGAGHLPNADVAIELFADGDARRVTLRAASSRGETCVAAVASSRERFQLQVSPSSSSSPAV
jgi:tRNA threonylcarbamoyladenosine biosynthesis protein TsaE